MKSKFKITEPPKINSYVGNKLCTNIMHISFFSITKRSVHKISGSAPTSFGIVETNLIYSTKKMKFSAICSVFLMLLYEANPDASNETTHCYSTESTKNSFEFNFTSADRLFHTSCENSSLWKITQDLNPDEITNVQMHGCEFATISEAISEFSNLNSLDISYSRSNLSLEESNVIKSLNAKLLKLNVSHSNLVELPEKFFIKTPNITVIDFSYNLLDSIFSSIFRGANELKNLHLQHNEISYIAVGAFVYLKKLDSLDLHNNKLKKVSDIFPIMAKFKIIHLENNPIEIFDCNVFKLLSTLVTVLVSWQHSTQLDISCLDAQLYMRVNDRHELLTSTDGRNDLHCNQFSFRKLKTIKAKNSQMRNVQQIVTFLGQLLESFERLDMRNSKLAAFDFSTLGQMKKLTYLDISNCHLKRVKYPSVLASMGFTEFYAGGNRIQNAYEIIRFMNASIIHFSLSKNFVGKINETMLNRLQSLQSLFLSDTQLEFSASNPFGQLTSLQLLDISRNNLRHVNFTSLAPTLIKLMYLDASNAHIANAVDLVKCLGPSIWYLDLSGNSIGPLNATTFDKVTNLQELYLRDTGLSIFDSNPFEKLTMLFYLDVSKNNLNGLNFTMFQMNFKKLQYLNVSGCQIENGFDVIKLLGSSMNILDLSGNHVGELNATTFVKLKYLFELCLSNTNLIIASSETFNHFRRLNVLDVSFNNLQIADIAKISMIFQYVRTLSVAGRQINHFPNLIKLLGRQIESLDLSGSFLNQNNDSVENTQVTSFNFSTLKRLHGLKSLNISYNRLKHLNIGSEKQNLERLDLRGNEFTEIHNLNKIYFPRMTELAISENRFGCQFLEQLNTDWENLELIDNKWSQKNQISCHPDDQTTSERTILDSSTEKTSDHFLRNTLLIVLNCIMAVALLFIVYHYALREWLCPTSTNQPQVSYTAKEAEQERNEPKVSLNDDIDEHIYEEIEPRSDDAYDRLNFNPPPSSAVQQHYKNASTELYEEIEN